jgi:SAM-dependent methyltransferase
MYQQSAAIYDAVATQRHDYAKEAERLHEVIQEHKRTAGNRLLDVACGTGAHWPFLLPHYAISGLDQSAAMLAIASQRHPKVPLHQDDLENFDLGQRFDIVTCLGSAIGYAKTAPRMRQAIQTMAGHLIPGGVLIVEPWFSPAQWEDGRLAAELIDDPALKIARMLVSSLDATGSISTLDMHYLVATPQGVESFTERHDMGLFTQSEYERAFIDAGPAVTHDPVGLMGRGLYIGSFPTQPAP